MLAKDDDEVIRVERVFDGSRQPNNSAHVSHSGWAWILIGAAWALRAYVRVRVLECAVRQVSTGAYWCFDAVDNTGNQESTECVIAELGAGTRRDDVCLRVPHQYQ